MRTSVAGFARSTSVQPGIGHEPVAEDEQDPGVLGLVHEPIGERVLEQGRGADQVDRAALGPRRGAAAGTGAGP